MCEVCFVKVALPAYRVGDVLYVFPHFGRAPYFVLAEVFGEGFKVLDVIRNPYVLHERGKGRGIVSMLLSHNVDAVIVSEIGHGAFYALRGSGVKIFKLPKMKGRVTIEKALTLLTQGKLEEAHEPTEHH